MFCGVVFSSPTPCPFLPSPPSPHLSFCVSLLSDSGNLQIPGCVSKRVSGWFVRFSFPSSFFFLILIHNSSHTHTHGQREKRAPCRTAEPPRDPLFRASFTIVSYRAARVAQRFSAAFSPGRDPGVPGSSPTSGSLHWSLLLPLCLCPPPPLS